MLQRSKDIIGFTVETSDGEVGKVCDLLLNAGTWNLDYLVIRTGLWMLGKEMLVPRAVLSHCDHSLRHLRVHIGKDRLLVYPDIEGEMPVSMLQTLRIHNYYQWDASPFWGDIHTAAPMVIPLTQSERAQILKIQEHWNSHLHSAQEIFHYRAMAGKDELGRIQDLLINDDEWKIEAFVISSKEADGKIEHTVPSHWAKEISWAHRAVIFDMTKDFFEDNPVFSSSRFQ